MTRTKSSQPNNLGQQPQIKNLFSNWPKVNLLLFKFLQPTASISLLALTASCTPPQQPRATNCQPTDVAIFQAARAEPPPELANNSKEGPKKSYQYFPLFIVNTI